MGCDWDGYKKTGYMTEKDSKKYVWTGGSTRNMENKNWSGIDGDKLGVQLKSGPSTKPWIFPVRCYL